MRPFPIKGSNDDPDAMVHVLVVRVAFMCTRALRSAAWNDLPVGSAGKVVTLLSSGIDSPVAT